ncbi:polysaccharide deacetylase [Mycobacterium sp. MS1601]|uniref:polysaccharide deacetylase family protein n=1 Tax=Mycobacterium sp. MS1601 TaxID=1936029 RepID=UPI00097931DD|nr:polysaccharide deacetylase family protein [Mycobacterium sp. MS1601]AQA02546.1 polysaccharide deacetylase [Mycobacterium sp. MS1601]
MSDTVPILMYHAIADAPSAATRRLSVSPRMLAEQLVYLLEHGYTGLTFGEVAESFRHGTPLPTRPVVLTFDDGYADFGREAWPILRRHGFPATLFVTTGWVAGNGPCAAGIPLDRTLDWKQLRALAESGLEVGAHSHSHPQLDQLSDVALQHELWTSRVLLEAHLETPVTTMSYPFGYSTPRVRAAAATTGYEYAAVVGNRCSNPSSDRFRVPRLTIRRNTSLAAFAAAVGGSERPFRTDRALTAAMASLRLARRAGGRVLRDG